MNATSADVARHAGVSRATVSQVLNGRAHKFAPQTQVKVLQAAQELDYQPSAAGRALRRGSSDFVLALIPYTTFGGNLQSLYEKMGASLAERGFTLVLQMAASSTEHLDRVVTAMRPAAVMSLTSFTDAERQLLSDRAVLAIDPPSSTQVDHNHAIGHLQARTLLEHGHRRLAFAHLQDARQDPFGSAREQGVRAAVRDAGGTDIDVIRVDIDPVVAGRSLESLAPPGVGIACYNDDVATALLHAALSRGWRIPEEVALIGMDHTPLSRITLPPLTTIEYDLESASQSAASSLLAALGAAGMPALDSPALSVIEGGTV